MKKQLITAGMGISQDKGAIFTASDANNGESERHAANGQLMEENMNYNLEIIGSFDYIIRRTDNDTIKSSYCASCLSQRKAA